MGLVITTNAELCAMLGVFQADIDEEVKRFRNEVQVARMGSAVADWGECVVYPKDVPDKEGRVVELAPSALVKRCYRTRAMVEGVMSLGEFAALVAEFRTGFLLDTVGCVETGAGLLQLVVNYGGQYVSLRSFLANADYSTYGLSTEGCKDLPLCMGGFDELDGGYVGPSGAVLEVMAGGSYLSMFVPDKHAELLAEYGCEPELGFLVERECQSLRDPADLASLAFAVDGGQVRVVARGEGVALNRAVFRTFSRYKLYHPVACLDGMCYGELFSPVVAAFVQGQLGREPALAAFLPFFEVFPDDCLYKGCVSVEREMDLVHLSRGSSCAQVYELPRDRGALLAHLSTMLGARVGGRTKTCAHLGLGHILSPECAACREDRRGAARPTYVAWHGQSLGDKGALLCAKTDFPMLVTAQDKWPVVVSGETSLASEFEWQGRGCVVKDASGTCVPVSFPEGSREACFARVPELSMCGGLRQVVAQSGSALLTVLPSGCVYEVCGVLVESPDPVVLLALESLVVTVRTGVLPGGCLTVRRLDWNAKHRAMHRLLGEDAADTFFRFWRCVGGRFGLFRVPGPAKEGDPTDGIPVGDQSLADSTGVNSWEFPAGKVLLRGGLHGTYVSPLDSTGEIVVERVFRVGVGSHCVFGRSLRRVLVDSGGGFSCQTGDDDYALDGGGPSGSDGEFYDEV